MNNPIKNPLTTAIKPTILTNMLNVETRNTYPTSAYSSLSISERALVDEYVQYVKRVQHDKRERVINAVTQPIPQEFINRSNGMILKHSVLNAINEQIKKASDEQDISADKVIKEYCSIAHSSVFDFVEMTDYGTVLKSLDTIEQNKLGSVKSIEIKPTQFGNTVKIIMHDKQPALRALAEMTGLTAPDRPPVLVEFVKPPVTIDTTHTVVDSEAEYIELLEAQ